MEPKMLVSEAAEALGVTAQALHNQIKRKNLPHDKSRNRVYFAHQTAKELLGLHFSPQILSFQILDEFDSSIPSIVFEFYFDCRQIDLARLAAIEVVCGKCGPRDREGPHQ